MLLDLRHEFFGAEGGAGVVVVAGLFLLSEDRAPGSARMTQVDIRKYDPAAHVFGAPRTLVDEAVAEPVAGGALYENQETGHLAVAWPRYTASGEPMMQLWTSTTGGKTWSGPTDIAIIASGYAQADASRGCWCACVGVS